MFIFEIIPGTPQCAKMERIFNWTRQFDNPDFLAEFESKIGVEFNGNCSTNTRHLLLERISEGTRNQFKIDLRNGKKCNFYDAKEKSNLNQTYLGLIRKYGIQEHALFDFTCQWMDDLRGCSLYHQAFNRYFIEPKSDCTEKDIDKYRAKDFLKEIPAPEYLRLMADYIEQREKEAVESVGKEAKVS